MDDPRDLPAGRRLDDPRRLVFRAGGDPRPVRAPRHRLHPAVVDDNPSLPIGEIRPVELQLRLRHCWTPHLPRIVAGSVGHALQREQHRERCVPAAWLVGDRPCRLRQEPRLRDLRVPRRRFGRTLTLLCATGFSFRALGLLHRCRALNLDLRFLCDELVRLARRVISEPAGQPGQHHRHHQPRRRAPRDAARLARRGRLCLRQFGEPNSLDIEPGDLGRLTGADVVAVQFGRLLGRRAVGEPALGLDDVGARQQPVVAPARPLPVEREVQQAGRLAQPAEVGAERGREIADAGDQRRRHGEIDVVDFSQGRWRRDACQRQMQHRQDALVQFARALHLPAADFRRGRRRRQHEHHRVGAFDQSTEAGLPVLALLDGMAVNRDVEAAVELQTGDEFVGEFAVGAGVGDEDFQLFGLSVC